MFHREFNILKSQSFFLFGPRGAGKSTLLRTLLPAENSLFINLLEAKFEEPLRDDPDELVRITHAAKDSIRTIVIYEIQKIPKLLDLVHHLIETTNRQFILTGSSARRLKLEGANLLAGRAIHKYLHPLTSFELLEAFDLKTALTFGMLPKIWNLTEADERNDFLQSYALSYIKEEVWGEQFIRKLDPFRRFLDVAAQANGKIVNFSNIASDVGVDTKTVQSYFEILEDTLMGFFLPSYSPSVRKTYHKAPKFYFFDTGVTRALSRRLSIEPQEETSYYGELFEQFVILEIQKYLSYHQREFSLFYLTTKSESELDLIIVRPGRKKVIVEIKSAKRVKEQHITKMAGFRDEFPKDEFYCLSQDPIAKDFESVKARHWSSFREILETPN